MQFRTHRSTVSQFSAKAAAALAATLRGAPKTEEHKAALSEVMTGKAYRRTSIYTVTFKNGESFTAIGQAKTARLVTLFTGVAVNHAMPSHWTRGKCAIHPRFGIESVSREEVDA